MIKKHPVTTHRLAKAQDLVQLEDKVDGIAETVNTTLEEVRGVRNHLTSLETKVSNLPTKEDFTKLLTPLVSDTARIKTVLRQKLNVGI